MRNRVLIALAFVCMLSLALFVSRPAAQGFGGPSPEVLAKAEAAPTPRMANGHPSLTGFWAGGGVGEDGAPPVTGAESGGSTSTSSDEFSRSGLHEVTKTADGSVFFSYAGANGGTEVGADGYTAMPTITAP